VRAPSRASVPLAGSDDRLEPSADRPERAPRDLELDLANRLFEAGRYEEAGRGYAALARQNRLPANRKEHWAYCRAVAVARRIEARPRSAREWDEIEGEVQSIQRLAPRIWLGEYLRNKVAETRRAGRRPWARADDLVVRGSAPDEVPAQPQRFGRLLGRTRGASAAAPQVGGGTASNPSVAPASEQPLNLPGPAPRPDVRDAQDEVTAAGAAAGPSGTQGDADRHDDFARSRVEDGAPAGVEAATPAAIDWQTHETPNFRIYHCDPALAQRAAEVAESVRTAQAKRWSSPATRATWTPRCDLYLYPSSRDYARATGQPENSPGISTMANNGVRVLSRRMNLRADNPQLLTTILPHEVTHIVLADLFVAQQIPRWADEGLAVLAEPLREQHLRAAELQGPLEAGRVFDLTQLMAMDYPEAKDWSLYYAQSVSLTRYLVEQGPPERFIRFVRDSQRSGPEAALHNVYQIDGLPVLRDRWLDYARKQVAVSTAVGRDGEGQPPTTERR
jgi:hypothetical protein